MARRARVTVGRAYPMVVPWLLASVVLAAAGSAVAVTGGYSVDEVLATDAPASGGSSLASVARLLGRFTVQVEAIDEGGRAAHACTGVIVHPSVVMTAAHCLVGEGGRRLRVRIPFPVSGTARPAWRESVDEAIHPRFARLFDAVGLRPRAGEDVGRYLRRRGGFAHWDLALVLLHRPVPDGFAKAPLVSPGFRDSPVTPRVIAGFGLADGRDAGSAGSLRFAEVRVAAGTDEGSGAALMIEARSGRRGRVNSCREVAFLADIDAERATLQAMFRQLTAGTHAEAGNPF